jgi:hypothetical protein
MASNIDTSNIDETYPVAGVDNNSQGFRENFAFIKAALDTAKEELTEIQSSQPQSLIDLGIADGETGTILTANGNGTYEFKSPGDAGIVGDLGDLSDVTVSELLNNQILKYNSATQQWVNSDSLVNIENFTTDDLSEGETNLYLTKERYDEFFGEAYTKNTGDLLSSTSVNSLEVPAIKVFSNTIQVSEEFINSFKTGDNIRIFGASENQSYLTDTGSISAQLVGFIEDPSKDTFTYKVCQFNTATGKISSASAESAVSGIELDAFNLTKNVRLNITRTSHDNGILIYRKLTGTESTASFNLIAVLGEKEFEGAASFSYIDYNNFDNNDQWSKKNNRNEFTSTSGVVHFPLTAPTVPLYGWEDVTIQNVDYDTRRITLDKEYFLESNLIVSHDDTAFLQEKINASIASNINSLVLAPKTYIVSKLTVPSNFSILGRGSVTKIKKLSWSSADGNNIVASSEDASRVTIDNIFFDGNMQNQYLKTDDTNTSVNYAINLNGSNHKITNLIVDNTVNGGIFAEDNLEPFITFNKITNGGLTDRYECPPLFLSGSTEITVSNNFIKNFPSAIDASIVDIGILNGNTVSNCGTGILIFGSTKIISSPNLVLGPAGEYIPGPDILNSEYDSVNIVLQQDTNFISDNYVYQENGEVVDLTANRAFVSYKINPLSSLDNVEELGDEILINDLPPAAGIVGTDLTQGVFRFAIARDAVNELKTTYGYRTLKLADPESGHIGLVYRVLLTEYVPAGQVVNVTGVSPFILNPITTEYEIIIENMSNIAVGSRVRFLGHGGTPDLNNLVGTVIRIDNYNPTSKKIRIKYDQPLTTIGSGGTITVENTFTLAKGRIL